MMTWKLKDLGTFFKNSFVAILQGEFLLRLHIEKIFVHIVYTFFLFGMIIWVSLMIETTMSKVESNKKILKELEIVHSQKVYEVSNVSRRSTVEAQLEQLGSEVREAEQPATILEK